MAEYLTSELVRNKHMAAMPSPLGEIFHWLHVEAAWLHIKWADFRRLYAAGQQRVDLLNVAAPAFFSHLQRMMWEDALLHLCRITDPVKTMGHDHLTVMRFPDSIPDQGLREEIKSLVEDVKQRTQFARDWRNRRLAHQELPPIAGQTTTPTTPPSCKGIEDALAAVVIVMNRIEWHYLKERVQYEQSIEALGGVECMVAVLTKGLQAEEAERDMKPG